MADSYTFDIYRFTHLRPKLKECKTKEPSFRSILLDYYISHGIERKKALKYVRQYIWQFCDLEKKLEEKKSK